MESGKSNNIRHLARTHRVDLAWLHEQVVSGAVVLRYCDSNKMAADIFTKAFTSAEKWWDVCKLIGQVFPSGSPPVRSRLGQGPREPSPGRPGAIEKGKLLATTTPSAAPTLQTPVNRRLVEFCCGKDSKLGQLTNSSRGCEVVRLTQDDDVTTPAGFKTALQSVSKPSGALLLWASIPCTGGSAWQHINKRHSNGRLLIKKHKLLFRSIWAAFIVVAERCWLAGGHLAIEWPRGCSYWHEPDVVAFMKKYDMKLCKFSGCALGLVSVRNGLPIRKPWTVATTCSQLREGLGRFECPGTEIHPVHQPCEGRDTKLTESYTDHMVKIVHDAFRQSCSHSNSTRKTPPFPPAAPLSVGQNTVRGDLHLQFRWRARGR